MAWLREMLKISVRTSMSESVQSLSTCPEMLIAPAAFLGFTLRRVLRTSAGSRWSVNFPEQGGAFVGVVVLFSSNRLKKVISELREICVVLTWWGCLPVVCVWLDALLQVPEVFYFYEVWLYFFHSTSLTALTPWFKLALVDLKASLSTDLKAVFRVLRSSCTLPVNQGFSLGLVVMFSHLPCI